MTLVRIRFAALSAVLLVAALTVAPLAHGHANMDFGARLSVPPFLRASTTERIEVHADVLAFDPGSALTLTVEIDAGTFTAASMGSQWQCTREAKRVRCHASEAAAGPHTMLLDVTTPASGTMRVSASITSLFGGDPVPSNNLQNFTARVYAASACNAQAPALVSAATSDGVTTLSWSAVDGATSYEVFAGLDGETPRRVASAGDTDASTRLPGGGDVTWFVRANFENCPAVDSATSTFASAGASARFAATSIASPLFAEPVAVALDGDYVLVTDAGRRALRSYHIPSGSVFDEPMLGETNDPPLTLDGGLAIGPGRFLYIVEPSTHLFRYVYPNPRAVFGAAGTGNTPGSSDGLGKAARLRAPLGAVSDARSVVFVADSGNNTIRRVVFDAPKGEFAVTTFVNASAGLNGPAGLALDADGNLYVADRGNHVIRRVTPSGVVTTIAGVPGQSGHRDGDAAQTLFHHPFGIGVDPWGNVIVSEESNHTIRKIAPNGRVTTIAGTPGTSGNADGAGTNAAFNRPAFLVVDPNGVIWLADRGNGTLRRLTASIAAPKRRAARN